MSITVADAKKHLNIAAANTADDDLIETFLIPGAISAAERYTGITIEQIGIDSPPVYATQKFDEWGSYLELEKSPVIEVVSITYIDGNGDTQTWADANWVLDTRGQRAIIYPAYGISFPIARSQPMAITVEYDAGYESYPADIRIAILMIISTMYAQREDLVVGAIVSKDLPYSSRLLLDPYRVLSV
jgi:uncharacterized phiE125 gp8 family phage protein